MLSLHLNSELQTRLEQLAQSRGQSLEELVEQTLVDLAAREQEQAKTEPKATVVSFNEVLAQARKLNLTAFPPLKLNVHNRLDYPIQANFRREEIYDDDGR